MKSKFTITAQLPATPEEVFRAWLSSDGHSGMTGSPAKVEGRPGGTFTAWDGYITGKTLELKPYSRILQSWRTSEFAADAPDSRVEVTLKESAGGTKLTLVHSEIPEGQADGYKAGWEEWYFSPMRDYFSK